MFHLWPRTNWLMLAHLTIESTVIKAIACATKNFTKSMEIRKKRFGVLTTFGKISPERLFYKYLYDLIWFLNTDYNKLNRLLRYNEDEKTI